jgi:hypothetical protein
MSKKSKVKSGNIGARGSKLRRKTVKVASKQRQMPAGYITTEGRLATLDEVVDPSIPTLSLAELTPSQRAELVAQRIEHQENFEVAMIGAGIVNRERAIAEVRARTKVGRTLIEIEKRMIDHTIRRAKEEWASRRKK